MNCCLQVYKHKVLETENACRKDQVAREREFGGFKVLIKTVGASYPNSMLTFSLPSVLEKGGRKYKAGRPDMTEYVVDSGLYLCTRGRKFRERKKQYGGKLG